MQIGDNVPVSEKRTVAKKACLSCREKKIKCDGELIVSYPLDPSSKKTFYKTCSNCKSSNTECVFVPSRRGGRRKKGVSMSKISNLNSNANSVINNDSYLKSDDNSSIISSSAISDVQNSQIVPILNDNQMYPNNSSYNTNYISTNEQYQVQNQASWNGYPSTKYTNDMNNVSNMQNMSMQFQNSMPVQQISNQIKNQPVGIPIQMPMQMPMQIPMQMSVQMPMQMQMPLQMPMQVPSYMHAPSNNINSNGEMDYGNYEYSKFVNSENVKMSSTTNIPNNISNVIIDKRNNEHLIYTQARTQIQTVPPGNFETENGYHYQASFQQQYSNGNQISTTYQNYRKYDNEPQRNNKLLTSTQEIPCTSNLQHNEQIDDRPTNQNGHPSATYHRDSDSWAESLAPSDSVTMIEEKRRNKLLTQHNNVQPCSINHSKRLQKVNTEETNSSSNKDSNSNSNVSYKVLTESLATDISPTDKWINEQSNELKRNSELIEENNNKKQKYMHVTKLNLEYPPFINDEILKRLNLPDYETLYKLIGLYYKYVHPNNLILPNMSVVIQSLSVAHGHILVLASVCKMSCKYLLNHEVKNDRWIDESFWVEIIEKYQKMASIKYLLLSAIIQCTRADDEYIIKCIEYIRILKVEDLLNTKLIKDFNSMQQSLLTSRLLLDREISVRMYWNTYKISLYRRISFGYPYKIHTDETRITLNKDVELPLPDVKYFKETENMETLQQSFIKTVTLQNISIENPDGSQLHDATCLILSLSILDEVLESISTKTLLPYTILKFSHKLNKMFQIHTKFKHLQAYHLETHPKKEPHIIINASNFTSVFLNRLTFMFFSVHLSNDILLYLPKYLETFKSQVKPLNDFSIVEVDPKLIFEKSSKLSSNEKKIQNWSWLLKSIDTIDDLIFLLRLGDGVCSATLDDNEPLNEVFQTLVGPCCSGSSVVEEWCKFNTWTLNVSNISKDNQGWIQMPNIVVWSMIQCLPFLATISLALMEIAVIIQDVQEPKEGGKDIDGGEMKRDERSNGLDEIELSDNEDEDRRQVTSDAGRIDSGDDFKRKFSQNNSNESENDNSKSVYYNKTVTILNKITREVVVSGIEYSSAPSFFNVLSKERENNDNDINKTNLSMINIILEKMRIIRRLLRVFGKYNGDCMDTGNYCDKLMDYIEQLRNKL